jgi:hypothetical protein
MKICLFDSIHERHVCESLLRAFNELGHQVHWTGAIQTIRKGPVFPHEPEDLSLLWRELQKLATDKPDVLLNIRASTLRPDMLNYLRSHGIFTAVWFPDDPVLYKQIYSSIVESYDVVLHCGGPKVLSFYTERHGATGINFPFWTDNTAFPFCFNSERCEWDVIFLGNCNGPVRRARYDFIASLPFNVRVFGRVQKDPAGIHGGYLQDAYTNTGTVTQVLANAKVGLSISQFFEAYAGSEYDYPELKQLGYFQFPSRIIQYAASGLPIISIGDQEMRNCFPELVVAGAREEVVEAARALFANRKTLDEASHRVHERFRRNYSALSRAKCFEAVVASPAFWRRLDATERAELFMQFPAPDGP